MFLGDVVIFAASLWITLFIRYGRGANDALFEYHLVPFLILFGAWYIVFFIAGLYEKRAIILKSNLSGTIWKAQLVNITLSIAFFYFIPYFGITPKTNLFIYLAVSSALILLWRVYVYPHIGIGRVQNAIVIAGGEEMKELVEEVNQNPRYNLRFISSLDVSAIGTIDFKEEIVNRIYSEDVSIIAVDFKSDRIDPILPHLYNLIFSQIVFVDMHTIYEDVFDRIPLSLVRHSWFLENISFAPKYTYDFLKRVMDVCVGFILGVCSLVAYPIVLVAVKLDDGGPLMSVQTRVGANNRPIKMFKFRTMTKANDAGKWGEGNENKITRVGAFLRKTRIDELPQLWNVVSGSLSLIGPRPEFPDAVAQYETQIPYYGVRHLIKPGLSGWAQIYHDNHPHHGVVVNATAEKLSYDLYYLKNRSFALDVIIALKTVKKLLSRSGV